MKNIPCTEIVLRTVWLLWFTRVTTSSSDQYPLRNSRNGESIIINHEEVQVVNTRLLNNDCEDKHGNITDFKWVRDCEWLKNRKSEKKGKFCKKEEVKSFCLKTCENCSPISLPDDDSSSKCSNKNGNITNFEYKGETQTNKDCEWVKSPSDELIGKCKVGEVKNFCVKTCDNCPSTSPPVVDSSSKCKNNDGNITNFEYKGETQTNKDCKWVKSPSDEIVGKCKVGEVKNFCLKICENCPSTIKPTSSPVVNSSPKCKNNNGNITNFEYKGETQTNKDCEWVRSRISEIVGKCKVGEVKNFCLKTCDNCPSTIKPTSSPVVNSSPKCKNNDGNITNFKYKGETQTNKDCKWVKGRISELVGKCKVKEVKNFCLKTCSNCPSMIKPPVVDSSSKCKNNNGNITNFKYKGETQTNKDCEWVKSTKSEIVGKCKVKEVKNFCLKTCSNCPSMIKPPVVDSSSKCKNNNGNITNFKYKGETQTNKDCKWVKSTSSEIVGKCKVEEVKNFCLKTCSNCPGTIKPPVVDSLSKCKDKDGNMTSFKYEGEITKTHKDCEWVKSTSSEIVEKCKVKRVKNFCLKTCSNCPIHIHSSCKKITGENNCTNATDPHFCGPNKCRYNNLCLAESANVNTTECKKVKASLPKTINDIRIQAGNKLGVALLILLVLGIITLVVVKRRKRRYEMMSQEVRRSNDLYMRPDLPMMN